MENNRKNIVINAEYQFRLAKLLVSLIILTINLLLIASVLAPQLIGVDIDITQKGAIVIAITEIVLFVSVWFISLRLSHRVVGPVYALSLALEKIERGDLTAHLVLREKDEFKEVAETINRAISATRDRLLCIQQKVGAVRACSADSPEIQSAITDLQDILKEFTLAGSNEDEVK
ncbi:MAG: HAMP domain-containing protein [Porticoccaceae bacterium]|nr:HAMP domain-containing protein [Porticoccaceae bacterium]